MNDPRRYTTLKVTTHLKERLDNIKEILREEYPALTPHDLTFSNIISMALIVVANTPEKNNLNLFDFDECNSFMEKLDYEIIENLVEECISSSSPDVGSKGDKKGEHHNGDCE